MYFELSEASTWEVDLVPLLWRRPWPLHQRWPRQKQLCYRELPAPTPPETTEGETKLLSPTICSVAAFHQAEIQEAKHSHTASLLHTPGTPHHSSNTLTPQLHTPKKRTATPYLPLQTNRTHGLHTRAPAPKQQLSVCFPRCARSRQCPTSPAPLTLLEGRGLSPRPSLITWGIANRPQLRALGRQGQAGLLGEQPGHPAHPLCTLPSCQPLVKDRSSGFGQMHQRVTCCWPPRRCLLAHIWDHQRWY